MFGAKPTFGSGTTAGFGGGGGFGTPTPTSSFGATQQTTSFGQAAPAFGQAAPAASGGLFGSTQPAQPAAGGLFGAPQPTASTGFGGGFGATSSFGGATSAFKPAGAIAGGFGATSTGGFGGAASTAGGMFGTTASQPNQSFSGFGTNTMTSSTTFGQPQAGGAFGQQQAAVGTTIKFAPIQGTDTMMKSGVQQNISTRHQCISCMKEYDTKSIDELRCEDYMANRKGPQSGGTLAAGAQQAATTGGLFGAAPNQTAPAAGGLFGSTATSQPATGGLFGANQSKPLFGSTSTAGFGATATNQFGATSVAGTGAFGAPVASTAGGMFGAKTGGFGAAATTASTGFGFGATQTPAAAGGMFGAQQNSAFKPTGFGATAQPATTGGLFGSSTPAFGAAAPAAGAFGQPQQPAAGAFGQPQQQAGSIGLFGANNQAKPLGFGGGFGAAQPATTAAGSFGFGAAQPATTAFGAAQQKPAGSFGFGAPQPATSTAFGFGQQQAAPAGSLFGAAQQKPAGFGFGAPTSTATSFGTPSFGTSFGAPAAGGSLFGNNNAAAKPLFGQTAGTSFGATNTFGTPGASSFGATGFGGTQMGGAGAFGQPQAQPQAQQGQAAASLQSQLASLTSNPYGDNPLFKNLLPDNNRREDIMKPTNPVAQKAALNSPQYKVSPHGLKAKVKPLTGPGSASKAGNTSLVNKSAIFDGLEEDEEELANIFVPRSSVKKLVLKPKIPTTIVSADVTLSVADTTSSPSVATPSQPDLEESLNLNSVKKMPASKVVNVEVHDESFSNFVRKDRKDLDESTIVTSPEITKVTNTSQDAIEEEEDDSLPQPAGVKLRRAGYYTIPSMSELSTMVDTEGNLNVENFTIGRQGYGNIFFPGMTNIKGMNFDDIVFFRHKEVIVYPDDSKKPELGQGLNKKAQVTLDKVWPVDKTSQSSVKSPEKLVNLNYEEKLQKACLKLGARFVEYRPETGSWVFKVDHFSKYGLDDSDEDELIENAAVTNAKKISSNEPVKKLKTLQLRQENVAAPPNVSFQSNAPSAIPTHLESQMMEEDEPNLTSPMEETFQKIKTGSNRVKLMKATLFDDDDMEVAEQPMSAPPPNVDITKLNKSRPVILEARPTILEKRDLIEDIASSILNGSSNRGLGGGGMNNETVNQSLTSSLLKSQYLSMVASMKTPNKPNVSVSSAKKKAKLPRYTLQAGYDKQITLPNSEEAEDLESKVVVPKHVDHMLPLSESMLSSSNVGLIGDFALFMSRKFRIGWAPYWSLANPGDSFVMSKVKEAATDVFIERHESLPVDNQVIDSFESWLEVHLENCVLSFDAEEIPKVEIIDGLNALHAHADEADRQISVTQELTGVRDIKEVLDLIVALWGRLRPVRQDDDEVMDSDETTQAPAETETHKITMERKEALTKWLEKVTGDGLAKDLQNARSSGDHLDEILALLSGNKRLDACEKAQDKSDHYLAMLISLASGPNMTFGQLLQNQLERWQEARADKFIEEKRLKLYSLLSGNPVWPGTELTVNTCDNLDWLRAFGTHLWYLTSPAASISDALNLYEEAFQKETTQFGAYAKAPCPTYIVENTTATNDDIFDIRFHLLKLYGNKAHKIESIVVPKTYTNQPLDNKLGWLVSEILYSLGYRHMARREMLHMDFAAQLESMGLWQWAIFVLLHLQDPFKRAKLAKEVLGRNVQPSDEESAQREEFLQERLGVPLAWIADAKAVRAATEQNYGDQAWFLLSAESWNEAHEVIVKKIAPDAIINQDYEFFFSLLEDLANIDDPSAKVTNWSTQGQVYHDFITVDLKIRDLIEKRDETSVAYDIQTLRPKVMSLCGRIKSLPVNCAKERLCQSEIAKKMAHLARVVLDLDSESGASQENQTEILAQNLAQLPLPDDYMLQELRTLNRIHMKELLSGKM